AYGLVAYSNDSSANRLLVWTNPNVTAFDLTVADGGRPQLCNATITLMSGGNQHTATWRDVPRQQDVFARTLEHNNSDYNYQRNASGGYVLVGNLLTITTNGMAATVSNGRVNAAANMLAGASVFGAFATAPVAASEQITAPVAPLAASSFQRAYYDDAQSKRIFLTNGSQLFTSLPGSVPNQGGVGFVKDTINQPGGAADLVQQGVNGGWIDNPAQRCLGFGATNYVGFSTDPSRAPNIDELTIPGDMSLELWCRPQRQAATRSPNQRLLTFNRNAVPDDANTAIRYMAGLQDC